MTKINRKTQERLRAGLRRFKPLLKAARERDANRADTATLALDLLSDLFGFDRYSEVTSEPDNREAAYDFAIHFGSSVAMLVRVSPVCFAPDHRYLLATAQHALLHGVEWIVLTNGIGWQVHHVEDTCRTRPGKWSAKRDAARRKPVSTKFSQAADDRTVLRIPKRWTLKKCFDVANSPRPTRPAGASSKLRRQSVALDFAAAGVSFPSNP